MKCLLQNATMKPALNQLQYHVGMVSGSGCANPLVIACS